MKLGRALETGIIIIVALIGLKVVGGVEGLTKMFSGLTGFLGGNGNGNGLEPSPVTPDLIEDIVEGGGTVTIEEEEKREGISPWSLISPLWGAGEIIRYFTEEPEERETVFEPSPKPRSRDLITSDMPVGEVITLPDETPFYIEPEPWRYRSGR